MAMPISNTHLRVPRGFGALLEGLTREILRDQPKDIPKYAVKYFEALLKQREESGIDTTDWAAKQEDRYYNNHQFKTFDLSSKTTISNETSQAEDYSGHSEEEVSLATTKTKASDSTEETEPLITTQEEESENEYPAENVDRTTSTNSKPDQSPNKNNDTIGSNQYISHSGTPDLQLLTEAANIDVSAQELSESEKDDQLTDQEEDEPENVNVCATEIEEKTTDEVSLIDEEYANTEQNIAHNESRPESPVSQSTEQTLPEEETKSKTNEVVASPETVAESNTKSKLEKSLVVVSFEDVPESQQAMNYESGQPVDIDSKPSGQEEELDVENQEETEKDKEANITNHFDDNHRADSAIIITSENLGDKKIKNEKDESSQIDDSEKGGDIDIINKTNPTDDDTSEIQIESDLQIEQQKMNAKDNETLSTSTNDYPEDDGEQQPPEDTLEKYILSQELHSEEEELMEDVKLDFEVQEGLSTCDQDNINPDLEQRPDQEATDLQEEHELPVSQRNTPNPDGETNEKQEECSRPQEEEDIMDIPLDDPEANRAAAKIQAGFRGHMTRKKMKPEDKTEGEERQEDRGQ